MRAWPSAALSARSNAPRLPFEVHPWGGAAMRGLWRRIDPGTRRVRVRIRGGRRPDVEALEARRLLTSAVEGTRVFALAGGGGDLPGATFQSDPTLDIKAATIDWGDGSPTTTGEITHLGE